MPIRFLIVDDNIEFRETVIDMVRDRHEDADIRQAAHLVEGIQALGGTLPHLALTDFNYDYVDGKTGADLVAYLRAQQGGASIQIIMISGRPAEAAAALQEMGVSDGVTLLKRGESILSVLKAALKRADEVSSAGQQAPGLTGQIHSAQPSQTQKE